MRLVILIVTSIMLLGCTLRETNPIDPYESINRKIHNFNMAFDATMLKPGAKIYKAALPVSIRMGINNAYNNVLMLPTVANDLLQGEWRFAIKDSWRFFINSIFGVAGLFDVASSRFALPPHYTDLGLTFAKWGDKKSPYIVIPFFGPSTIRDGMGMIFDFSLFTPYPYINNDAVIYGLIGLRYFDLRSQLLDSERLLDEALDKYSFLRDAYLQHRNFLINGDQVQSTDTDSLYVEEDEIGDYIDDEPPPTTKSAAHASSVI